MLKLDPKNTELLSQKQKILTKSIETTEDKLKQLQKIKEEADKKMSEGTEINEENYRNLQREILNTQNKLNKLNLENSKFYQAGQKIEEIGKKFEKIGSKVTELGNKLTTKLTLPLTATMTLATKEAIEFESAFAGVEKTVNATEEELENLKKGIKDLAKEIPSSTTEISAVAEAAGQLGIQTENILDFTKVMIDLGNSTNLSSEEAASSLAKFANIMEMSQDEFDKLGASIVDLGNNFATTEADIVSMAMRLAGAGKQVGLSEGQVLGLATALSSVGIEAEMGGSAISKAMVKMQNAVDLGGEKLNDVLHRAGISLRDLELMAANDSMSFKQLAQGIGMTSTEVKQLITAGTNLEDFAKISEMSAEQFKKAWKDDAAGALTVFIQGLGDAENKGESAITLLSEMGLTEVRLRDSLLRAANAGKLFNNAIKKGTDAWDENIALTKEANKRYATTESQLKITKNKIKDTAMTIGNKLVPVAKKLLDKINDLTDKFSNLSEEEQENILKIGLMVAAAGPLLKVIGTLGTTIGTTAKGIGIFSQAIGVLKNKTESSNIAANNLAGVLKKIVSPAGLATVGIAGLTAGLVYLNEKKKEATKETEEWAKQMSDAKKTLDDYNKSIDENAKKSLVQINAIKPLKEELKALVDENGKVKKGYESRVSFILNELSEALGEEYKLNGNVIEGYKELQKEIDKTIEKKEAEIKLNASEEKYKNAIENREKALDDLATAYDKLGTSIEEAEKKQENLNKKINGKWERYGSHRVFKSESGESFTYGELEDLKTQKKNLDNLISAYNDAESRVKTYVEQVKTYETDYAKFAEGKYKEIGKIVEENTKRWTDSSVKEIKEGLKKGEAELEKYSNVYKRTGEKVAQERMEQAQKNIEQLAEELKGRTSTVEELGQDEIEAWTILAQSSYDVYNEKVSTMADPLKKAIQKSTNAIVSGTPEMAKKAGYMATAVKEQYDKLPKRLKEIGAETIQEYMKGLSNDEKRKLLKEIGIENVNIVLKELDKGNLSEENGRNILQGLYNGLSNNKLQGSILGVASGLATAVNRAFTGKNGWDEHSPSKKMKGFAENYIKPIPTVMKDKERAIVAQANSLANKVNEAFKSNSIDYGKYSKGINSGIINQTKTVFTTPQIVFNVQELDEAKLNQCFNYINKKFGSAY